LTIVTSRGGVQFKRSSRIPRYSSTNDAVALLKDDHRRVEDLFEHYETADEADKADIVSTVCLELVIHTQLEEEIFYPACREAFDDEEPLNEAAVEHDTAKILIGEIVRSDEDDQFCDARIKILSQLIRTHVKEEERASDGIFAKAQQAGIDTADLARRLRERKQAFQSEARAGGLPPGELVSFHVRSTLMQRSAQENSMSMQNSRRGERRRDDDGARRYYRSRSRDDDDDRDRLGRRRGGWFGDPEGHTEAARRRWEEDDDRRYSRSRSRDDDDDDGAGVLLWSRHLAGYIAGPGECRRHATLIRRSAWRGRPKASRDPPICTDVLTVRPLRGAARAAGEAHRRAGARLLRFRADTVIN
jgi:hypothetical protein